MKKGDIYFIEFKDCIGSEQGGKRPVIIVKEGNEQVTVAAMTTKVNKKLPVHILVSKEDTGMKENSLILLEQLKPVQKADLQTYSASASLVNKNKWSEIQQGLRISLGY